MASPLPATIPGTLLAARQYARQGHIDRRVLGWSVAVGLPATLVGAWATRWVGADSLVVATDVLVAGLGVSILVGARRTSRPAVDLDLGPTDADGGGAPAGGERAEGAVAVLAPAPVAPSASTTGSVVAVALVVGLVAGLLANSGGFLLAPLYLVVLKLPMRPALGTSLAVSAALAVPGTVAHGVMGHIDWSLVLVFGAASVPLSALGARTALRVDPQRLEVAFGAVLVVLATVLLTWG